MYESNYKNNELENEVSLDMSYFWYSDVLMSSILHLVQIASANVGCTPLE